ncbi:hypothetical protein ACFQ1A_14735 [Massilia pinisoli]|uniref:hypothetical protein n=1 Tax=Massilia pinisoli TaxID=1772194 RepID=UPI00351D9708
MRDESRQTTFGCDGFGRRISKTRSVTGTAFRIEIDYNSSGRPVSLRLLAPGDASSLPAQ